MNRRAFLRSLSDFHQRFDLPNAIRDCNEIESLAPFFVEDPVRTEAFQQDLPSCAAEACLDFKNGKLYPNERPGLKVELDYKQLK
jgi:L-alanine-DL-glutamate epimerase-like enolase superfamily enzyme